MLAQQLSTLSSVRDVGRLFALLGYRVADASPFDDAQVVARWGSFKVVAVEAREPRDSARALAHRLMRRGERAIAVAMGPGDLCLATPLLATGTSRVLAISRIAPDAGALHVLRALRPKKGHTALEHALRIAELLSTERVGERFFTAFRMVFERMIAALDKRHRIADRRMVALLALTRVLFLYFVQAKGWLAGQSDYLRDLLDGCLAARRHFHRTALNPLFFGTLNRPARERSAVARRLGDIPYLNGGLFEPHPAERVVRAALFPNVLWRDAFDQVFERFRFCVREAHEVDVIAPDMLGHVFERLMDDSERHDTGTFYTPEPVVRQVVDATIATALISTLDEDVARKVIALERVPSTRRARALRKLRALRVLDPAAGSGAFLLGALERLTEMRIALVSPGPAPDRCRIRRAVLRDNLFGVDVNPMAVRLAELRLWLAVIADDPTESTAVTPLPNLNGVVRQGDTLFDPLAAVRALGGSGRPVEVQQPIHRVRVARRRLFGATGKARRSAIAALQKAEGDLARPLIRHAATSVHATLDDLAGAQRSRDLFGQRAGLNHAQRRRHWIVKRQRVELVRWLRQLEDGASPFFSFEVHAADAMAAGGFSVVLGNPPWVRAERLAPHLRASLPHRYSWWRSSSGRGFAHLPDLSIAFLQRAVELAAPGGAVGMLVPGKLVTAGYAEAARAHLARETTLTHLHRVSEAEARRFGATTYPLAIVTCKARPPCAHRVRLGFDGDDAVSQRSLACPGPWLLITERAQRALGAFLASGTPFGALARAGLGVKTGADRLFVGTEVSRSLARAVVRLGGRAVGIEPELIRPVIRGRDVRPFRCQLRRVIVWTHDRAGNVRRELPPLARRYFAVHQRALERRSDHRAGPAWALFRTAGAVAGHRVVWSDIARRPRALLLDASRTPDAIPLNTCYVASFSDRDIALRATTVLNSTWAAAMVAVVSDEARGGYRRVNARVVEGLPIPTAPHASTLADLGVRAHREEGVPREALDAQVADALELSGETRAALRRLAQAHR